MNIDLRSIIDSAGLTYLLLVIAFLLAYLAFKDQKRQAKK